MKFHNHKHTNEDEKVIVVSLFKCLGKVDFLTMTKQSYMIFEIYCFRTSNFKYFFVFLRTQKSIPTDEI